MQPILIIDFDSTFIKTEGLEELSRVVLAQKRESKRREIEAEVARTTRLGMEGKLDFATSLKKRLALLTVSRADLIKTARRLQTQVTESFRRNREFIVNQSSRIYVISGGFWDFVWPVVSKYGLRQNQVFANRFVFDESGKVIGVDWENPLSRSGGKAEVLKSLNFKSKIVVLGDGYSDFELRQGGVANKFIAFTENVTRQSVVSAADFVASNFDEFLGYLSQLENDSKKGYTSEQA